MEYVGHTYGSMIVPRGFRNCELARLAVELWPIAFGDKLPFPLLFWHETQAIDPIAVIKASDLDGCFILEKFGRQQDIDKGIAFLCAYQRDLTCSPLLNLWRDFDGS